jgi:hypothetical protein
MAEEQTYRDYRLVVSPEGHGWKVLIYEPGRGRERPEIPVTTDPTGRTTVIDEAKRIVDRLLRPT